MANVTLDRTIAERPDLAHPSLPPRHLWVLVLGAGYLGSTLLSRWDWPAAIVGGISAILFVIRVAARGRIDRIGWAALVYLVVVGIVGLAIGSTPGPSALIDFLGFEGRPYVAFLPLLLLATAAVSPRDLTGLRLLMRWSVLGGAGLFLVWIVGAAPTFGNRGNFFGLMSSHNASGLFFGVAVLVLLVPASGRIGRLDGVLGATALGLTLATGSRTAIFGVLVASIYLLFTASSLQRKIRTVALVVLAVGAILVLSGRVLSTVQYIGSAEFLEGAAAEFANPDNPEEGKRLHGESVPGGPLANALKRFGQWRASLDEFAKSPLIGIGPWRLNDTDRTEVGVHGVVLVAVDGERFHASGFGAHNLVLQTLAETGVVGLAMLAAPWILLVRRLRRTEVGGRQGMALIVFSVATVLTTNSMISPALCFPLFTYVMTSVRMHPDVLHQDAGPPA
ncbi:MAG TPA: O-antigen ligase family protein [Actinomycetota bacterium]|nr:O-antigen ligase family protein [Actinomycetota bacterium]